MEPPLSVDPTNPVPLHRQLYNVVRSAILTGRFRPGDRLPATRVLAATLGLSRTTVSDAYDQLQAEGYLLGRHGSGTFVASDLPHEGLRGITHPSTTSGHLPQLSAWGERVAAGDFSTLFPPTSRTAIDFDFHPDRLADEAFPWDAWHAASERSLAPAAQHCFSPPVAGLPDLLEAISRHVAHYRAVRCAPEQVVVVNGSQQGLNLLAHVLLDAGHCVAMEEPGYPAARLILAARGLDVASVPVDADGMVVDELPPAPRLIHVTPSHQHPTGATMSLARRLALLEVAERWRCVLVEDDYDSEFRYAGWPVESLQGLDRNGLVVYMGSFSKSLFPGLRLGFLVLPQHLATPLTAAKALWDSGTPIPVQATLAEFLHSGDYERHIRRMRRVYARRREALYTALHGEFGSCVSIGQCQGGLSVLVTLDLPRSDVALAQAAAQAGIALRPASLYFMHPPRHPTFLIGFGGMDEHRIHEGIARLASILQPPHNKSTCGHEGSATVSEP
jgi:GntR family transcriptional regulator/MocR family aminotransferase